MPIQRLKTTLVIAAIGALLIVVVPAANASHSWGSYHWARTTQGFTLLTGDNVNDTWQQFFNEATGPDGYWTTEISPATQTSEAEVIVLESTAGGTRARQCKTTDGRVEVCNERYGPTGWLGIAGISIRGDHIQAGYVKLNDTYFDTPTYNSSVWRRLVMCQEIGHTLGLGHQDEDFNNASKHTCMDYHGAPEAGDDVPNAHDYEQLRTIYSHTDTENSYDTGTTTGGEEGPGGPPPNRGGGKNKNSSSDASAWGREVASDGHSSTFVRQDGDTMWVTHVIWAN